MSIYSQIFQYKNKQTAKISKENRTIAVVSYEYNTRSRHSNKKSRQRPLYYLLCIILGGFLSLYCVLDSMMVDSPYLLATSLLVINICQVIFIKRNYNLLIIFSMILFFNYSIVIPNYFLPIESVFIVNPHVSYAIKSLNILFVFNYFLWFTIPSKIISLEEQQFWSIKCQWKGITHFILIVSLLYILVFEFNIPTVAGGRGGGTPIYEYSVILMLLGLSFTKSKNLTRTFIIISLLFILQENIFGARLIALQYIICIYILVFSQKYKLKKILPFAIVLFLFYNIIGAVRGGVIYGGYDSGTIIGILRENMFTQDTAYSAYYTSETNTLIPQHFDLTLFISS